jgi:hypothetical protein
MLHRHLSPSSQLIIEVSALQEKEKTKSFSVAGVFSVFQIKGNCFKSRQERIRKGFTGDIWVLNEPTTQGVFLRGFRAESFLERPKTFIK